ncbi:hypothetical protein Z517_01668 [Fonsecaea pedrosoi CBS 271.37]|uniref:VWFA domain-containing protein n=1 Tax=Fonsecaea pedrosoi CBS 271.37 TaxID=1442368 RepID=A0A0D2GYY8_9EURO|nr:uncharacterized protein Z517_01668 [Fonsecaea pedrosoi CBS 271.37]KIW86273.1 hypothetical protein Z517_01668 [Fonsecaea pedrosoi CBS 271.37]
MTQHASQLAEKYTQSLTSILGESNLRNLLESHVNRSMDSIDNVNPDALDGLIGAVSERSAIEMIKMFPSLLQERIQSPAIRNAPKMDDAGHPVSKPTYGPPLRGSDLGYFNNRNTDWGLETKPSFDGSQASTLVPERQEPHQDHPGRYSSNNEPPKRGVEFSQSPFSAERPAPTQPHRGVEISNAPFVPGGPTHTQPLQGVRSSNPPFISGISPTFQPNRGGVESSKQPTTSRISPRENSKLGSISELAAQNPESKRKKAAQMQEPGSTAVDPAASYPRGPDANVKRPQRELPPTYSSLGQPSANSISSSMPARERDHGAFSSETRHSRMREEPPLSSRPVSQNEERPLTPDGGSSESDLEERPLTPLSDDSEQTYAEVTNSPQKSQEFLTKTIKNIGLTGIYGEDNPRLQTVAANAAARAADVSARYGLPPKTTLGAIKLALYNFVILCDDSKSMRRENRIPALQTTLKRVVEIATLFEDTGISIRFLNYTQDSRLDDLRRPDDIVQKVASVRWRGITELGSKLHDKIIRPMIVEKVRRGTFDTPLIVVIITDGEPFGEDRETLRDKIRQCKQDLSGTNFGDGSVVFIISRVGSSDKALGFISELENSPGLEQMVYCSPDRLDEKMAILQPAAGNTKYTKYVSSLFIPNCNPEREKKLKTRLTFFATLVGNS